MRLKFYSPGSQYICLICQHQSIDSPSGDNKSVYDSVQYFKALANLKELLVS